MFSAAAAAKSAPVCCCCYCLRCTRLLLLLLHRGCAGYEEGTPAAADSGEPHEHPNPAPHAHTKREPSLLLPSSPANETEEGDGELHEHQRATTLRRRKEEIGRAHV